MSVRARCEVVHAACVAAALYVLGSGFCAPAVARAGGFPPVARAAATPVEAVVGARVQFSSAGSFDPDTAPLPLTFAWRFDDGAMSAEAAPTHVFSAPGAYRVTLVVSDGADDTEVGVTVFVLAPVRSPGPAWSSPLALLDDRRELWVANPDAGSVSVLAAGDLERLAVVDVGARPVAIAVSGAEVVIACANSGEIVSVDVASRVVRRTERVGARVGGLVALPDGRLLVTLPDEGAVVMLARDDLAVIARYEVGGEPRAIARNGAGDRAYVASFLSRGNIGQVATFDLALGDVPLGGVAQISLAMDPGPDSPSSSRGLPNLLDALAIDPAEETLWVGGLKSNVQRGLLRDGLPLTHDTRVRGMMTPVDVASSRELLERRIDTNDADAVSAIAFSPAGRFAYLAHPGLGAVSTYDLAALRLFSPGRAATVPFTSRVEIGDRADAIVVSRDGARMYVRASLSRTVAMFDLTDPAVPAPLATVEVVAESLSEAVALGRILFHSSRAPVHSRSGYIACASCHPDGGHDGQTWDFTHAGEGLRNTIDLRGRGGTACGPLHWSGNFDEVQDFENDIVAQFGGTGLADDGTPPNAPLGAPNAGRSAQLDALAAYVASLDAAPRSPHRAADGTHTESALRGREVFDRAGCARCHAGARFTDSTLTSPYLVYDVGTLAPSSGQRLGAPLAGIDTPSLLGAWTSAPYFHDGSAATLLDVLTRNERDQHGVTSTLDADARADLVAFLLELDRAEPESEAQAPSPTGGCGCAVVAPRQELHGPLLCALALLAVVVRRSRRTTRAASPKRCRKTA